MRQITHGAKMEALDLYLEGLSTNEIVAKTGISKGAVVSILKDAREGKFPQLELKDRIDELHGLSVRLRKEGLDLSQARLGFTLLERLWAIEVEPEKLKEWIEFCLEISPGPPEGFIPAAIELHRIERETGMSYGEIASKVKELSAERERLLQEVGDLQAKERKASELRQEIEDGQRAIEKLRAEKEELERRVGSLSGLLEKRAEEIGIPQAELEARLEELFSLEDEIAGKRQERNRLDGELEALSEREQKLSSRLEKATADFDRDLKLIKETRNELVEIAALKGRYEKEIEDLELATRIFPFLSDPDKVDDDDFSLISIVVNCVDSWIQSQPEWGYRYSITWDQVKSHVQSKRIELG